MPQQRQPQVGTDNGTWGQLLNNYLLQLSPSAKGGLHFASSDPTTSPRGGALSLDDEGYTYVNNTTNQIKRFDGSAWVTALSAPTQFQINTFDTRITTENVTNTSQDTAIANLQKNIINIQNFAGEFTGVDSPQIPVVTPDGNGLKISKIQYRKTAGTVVSGDTIQLKLNGTLVPLAILTLSTTNELTTYTFSTPLNLIETDEFSFTRPNNTTLAGFTSVFNVNN
jgi:hypothetical protein